MKRSLWLLIVCVGVAGAQPIRVAVLHFGDYSGSFYDFAQGIPDLLSGKFVAMGDVVVVERAQIGRVLDELHLSRTADFDQQTAVRVGRLLNVQAVILGGVYAVGNDAEIAARVVMVETGEVSSGYSVRGSSSNMLDLVEQLARKVSLAWSAGLDVWSIPSGALVYLDGSQKGTTPISLIGLRPGDHQIRLWSRDYDDWTSHVYLVQGSVSSAGATLQLSENVRLRLEQRQQLQQSLADCDADAASAQKGVLMLSIIGIPFGVLATVDAATNFVFPDVPKSTGNQVLEYSMGALFGVGGAILDVVSIRRLAEDNRTRDELRRELERLSVGPAMSRPGLGVTWRF